MSEKDFTEREFGEISSGFGELPEDLRGTGPASIPAMPFFTTEGDAFAYTSGADRSFVQPIPSIFGNRVDFAAINYFPRANYESFRSQRFIAYGSALLSPVGAAGAFTNLFVDPATIALPNIETSGVLTVPGGYAAVITGIRQWVGDVNAYQKPDGDSDDIKWQVSIDATAAYNLGNLPFLISSLHEEGKLYSIVSENTQIQLSVKNNIETSDLLARDIAVRGLITGHWFPIDELDDLFRNR